MSTLPVYVQWSSQMGNIPELYRAMQTKASIAKVLAFLTGRSRNLRDLTAELSRQKIRSQHYAGSRTVAIKQIKGSEGRTSDFDCDFNPLQTRTWDRWMSIAIARVRGDTLPLVELIQVGEDYYVRDGHHRISVASALREEYIDAKVIVLELEPISPALPRPSMAAIPA